MRRHGLFFGAILSAAMLAWAAPAVQDVPPVVSQETLGRNACGPCAVVNTLLRAKSPARELLAKIEGTTPLDKAKTLARRFEAKTSTVYGKNDRCYDEKRGMVPPDLAACFNELAAELGLGATLDGTFLDRHPDEGLEDHLRRVHRLFFESIRQGMPVVLSFRSFSPELNEKKKEYQWRGLVGHFVAVTDVQESIRPGEKGFSFTFADSFTGRQEFGYAWIDEARNFTAAKGDERTWKWLSDRPFLLVTAPSLQLGTQNEQWYLRTTIILNYAVFQPAAR